MKTKEFEKFRLTFLRKDKITISKTFKIVEALYNEAVALGVIPPKNPLDGLDVDLRIAAVINRVSKAS